MPKCTSLSFLFVLFLTLSCSKEETVTYTVAISSSPTNGGQVNPANVYSIDEGQRITFTATANEGFAFNGWEGTINESSPLLTLVGDKNYTLTANFRALPQLTDEVLVYDYARIDSLPIFAVENGGTKAYYLNKNGSKGDSYTFDLRLGNDITPEENGNLLGIFKPQNDPPFTFGGGGGILRELTTGGQVVWEYNTVNSNEIAHHDLTKLPNGNILTLIWERIPLAQALSLGASTTSDIFLEKIIEIDPSDNSIVWQWKSWEHIVQDFFEDQNNYGDLRTNLRKIDLNYNHTQANGDWMHANAITYDESRDLIFISVNFYHEVWVIDHSTTAQEATSSNGGNYGFGGDLVYRFGNPNTHNGLGSAFLDNVHHPNFSNETHTQMLLYSNGGTTEQSTVFEIRLPEPLSLDPDTDNNPDLIWNFTDPQLYNGKISGAVKLGNGNILITEGDFGFWEVTQDKLVVWKYDGIGNFWRAYATE